MTKDQETQIEQAFSGISREHPFWKALMLIVDTTIEECARFSAVREKSPENRQFDDGQLACAYNFKDELERLMNNVRPPESE